MSKSYYEDVFILFADAVIKNSLISNGIDMSAVTSLSRTLAAKEPITEKQSAFIIKLMQKYEKQVIDCGLDLSSMVVECTWRDKFRELDTTKSIWVEDKDGKTEICVRFPYNFKPVFDREIKNHTTHYDSVRWDKENRCNRLTIDDINVLQLDDFIKNHGFSIENSYLNFISLVEEIFDNQDSVIPHCIVVDDQVQLVNCNENAENHWKTERKHNLHDDLLLAKSMGFLLRASKPKKISEKIASTKNTKFWIPDIDRFCGFLGKIEGVKAVFVGNDKNNFNFLQIFLSQLESAGINKKKIKICYREDGESGKKFNDWVKEQELGGKIIDEEILIFKDKPPKWLFSKKIDVKIIAVNGLYPIPNRFYQIWADSHCCVFYIGEFKPSMVRGEEIAQL